MTDPAATPPEVVTPLESAYIRAAVVAALPALNWIIYATNLDEVLHITKVTTNQAYQCVVAVLAIVSVVQVVLKRIKDGKDPHSTAARIVLSKPAPDEFAQIAASQPSDIEIKTFPPPAKSVEQAMAEIEALAQKVNAKGGDAS